MTFPSNLKQVDFWRRLGRVALASSLPPVPVVTIVPPHGPVVNLRADIQEVLFAAEPARPILTKASHTHPACNPAVLFSASVTVVSVPDTGVLAVGRIAITHIAKQTVRAFALHGFPFICRLSLRSGDLSLSTVFAQRRRLSARPCAGS
jgi:hypothetical protein